jgi:hypothetical protein
MKKLLAFLMLTATPLFAAPTDDTASADNARHFRRFVCIAKSRGQTFRGVGPVVQVAKRKALRECRQHAFVPQKCRIVLCRRGI